MGVIYCLENKINGKKYIGQTIQAGQARWRKHKSDSFDKDTHLYCAMRKYGIDNFYYSILEEIDNELLNERERYWIAHFDTYHNGYNETLGGQGANILELDIDEIVAAYEIYHSTRKVASLFGCTAPTIADRLRSIGKLDPGYQRTSFDDNDLAEAYAELKSLRKVGELFGCDKKTVSIHLRKMGVAINPPGHPKGEQ